MEAVIIGLVGQAVQLLTPYLKKGFDKFSEEVGKAAAEKVKGLFNKIKDKISKDPAAADTVARYAKTPERYEEYFKDVLKEKLAQDEELASYLKKYLEELKPTLQIIQKGKVIAQTGKVTGLKSKEVGAKRDININQEYDVVEGELEGGNLDKVE